MEKRMEYLAVKRVILFRFDSSDHILENRNVKVNTQKSKRIRAKVAFR